MRPAYTGRRREALHIVRAADGALEVGCGRLRILPGAVPYFRSLINTLADMIDLPGSVEALSRGDALGRALTITQPKPGTVPANAWSVSGRDGGRIVFDPEDWPRPGDRDPLAAPAALLKLLWHADGFDSALPQVSAIKSPPADQDAMLRLSGKPSKNGDVLSFALMIQNPGPSAAYVMEGVVARHPETGAACSFSRPSVILDASGEVLMGAFIPPRPGDRLMAAPVIPVARLLPAGGALECIIAIPAPYAETMPWLPDASPRDYEPVEIRGISLAIAWWAADTPSLAPIPAAFDPELYTVSPSIEATLARTRFPVTGLRFSRRKSA